MSELETLSEHRCFGGVQGVYPQAQRVAVELGLMLVAPDTSPRGAGCPGEDDDDKFLETQLNPALFGTACRESGQELTLRTQPGYDHGYFFIATFVEDHLRHHAVRLTS